MKLTNDTGLEARLFVGALNKNFQAAQVVARGTYRIDDAGALQPSHEPWSVFSQPLETRYGTFPADMALGRNGCDLVVSGTAAAPQRTRALSVLARVGAFERRLHLYGDRFWHRSPDGSHIISEAAQFEAMELSWDRAFGGVAELRGQPTPHPLNPRGKGFLLEHDTAHGKPLPNIEAPDDLLTAPLGNPMPAGWGPVPLSLGWHISAYAANAAPQNAPPNDQTVADWVTTAGHGASPPRNVMPIPALGSPVRLELGARRIATWLPATELVTKAHVGRTNVERPLALNGVWVFADERLLVLTWQTRFRYRLRSHERRTARLLAA